MLAPERYRFGLAAGGIVMRDDTVLLVRNLDDHLDFWVLPGGGQEQDESLDQCAEREVFEETGLEVTAQRLLYVEEFVEDAGQSAKLWFLCSEVGNGEIVVDNPDPNEQIVEARFLSRHEMDGKTIYPGALRDRFWDDHDAGFPEVGMLGPVDLRTRTGQ